MYLPKSEIYNLLKTLGYYVSQTQPDLFNELPAIIFNVNNNSVNLNLDNEIVSQELEIIIDIWADNSTQASAVLSEVEKQMRSQLYMMIYSADVPNDGNIHHIYCRFLKKI